MAATVRPLLKWPGGKGGELERILPAMPDDLDRYFEPFVGGGATFFAMPATVPAFINDASADLMDLYARVQREDRRLHTLLEQLASWWRALEGFTVSSAQPLVEAFAAMRAAADEVVGPPASLDLGATQRLRSTVPSGWSDLTEEFVATAARLVPAKLLRMRTLEGQRRTQLPESDVWANIEGAFKASCYTTLRANYNRGRRVGERTPRQTARFFFLREYAYAAMFRFNAKGEFNVPYGGVSYNRKPLLAKVEHLRSPQVVHRLRNTTLRRGDFADFLERFAPDQGDFVFLDPPYDSDFRDYDRSSFGRDDHRRLAAVMAELPCPFQLVIKSTPDVLDIYGRSTWNVMAFDKRYLWTIKQRNDRAATHLLITNYQPGHGGPRWT